MQVNLEERVTEGYYHFTPCPHCELGAETMTMRKTDDTERLYGADRPIYECEACEVLAVDMPNGWYVI